MALAEGMRDYRKLIAFQKADALVLEVYAWTQKLPESERQVLRSQIRRSSISVAAEGSARSSLREYVHHLNIALGSAAETAYLIGLAGRIYPPLMMEANDLPAQANDVVKLLVVLVDRLRPRPESLKPKAQGLEPKT